MSLETADRMYELLLAGGLLAGTVALWAASRKREGIRALRTLRPHGSRAHNASLFALALGCVLAPGGVILLMLGWHGGPLHGAAVAAGCLVFLCGAILAGATSESRRAARKRRIARARDAIARRAR